MARLRARKVSKNGKVGRPKKVAIPTRKEERRPENCPSLMTYFKRKGSLKETTQAQMFKARHLFITKAMNSEQVSKATQVPIQIIEQWIVLFDWQERRDRLLFNSYRKVHTLAKERSKNLDERHDRIAGTMETLVEKLIHDHLDPGVDFRLAPRDVGSLTSALSQLQGIRRTVHDKPTSKVEVNKTVTLDTDGSFENMRGMIESLFGNKPQIEPPTKPLLEVSFPGGVPDVELEDALEEAEINKQG